AHRAARGYTRDELQPALRPAALHGRRRSDHRHRTAQADSRTAELLLPLHPERTRGAIDREHARPEIRQAATLRFSAPPKRWTKVIAPACGASAPARRARRR